MQSAERLNTITLHVGLPKTGTTSLQLFLATNGAYLKSANIEYVDAEVLPSKVWTNPTEMGYADSAEAFAAVWRKIKPVLAANDAVISDERLIEVFAASPEAAETLRAVLTPHPVRVVLYLRRQDLHAESFYLHRLKRGQLLFESATFNDIPELSLLHDYERLTNRLVDAFGKTNTIVRVFEQGRFIDNDLYKDFADAIGLKWSDQLVIPPRQNRSFDFNLMELYSELYSHSLGESEVFYLVRMLETIEKDRKTPRKDSIPFDDKISYLAGFEESNSRVAKTFFDREQLFSEPRPQSKTLSAEETAKLFSEYAVCIHHLWYAFITGGGCSLPLCNWLRVKKLQSQPGSLNWPQRIELFFRKCIHSVGWRLLPNWGTAWELEKKLWETTQSLPSRYFPCRQPHTGSA